MRIAVFGTPQLSAELFDTIYQEGKHEIAIAVTTPDAPAGRGKLLQSPPVKKWAEERGIKVFQPKIPDLSLASELSQMSVDLLLVISYGKILKPDFLEHAPPAWNLHFSLLPEYRGAAPVQSAILDGKEVSGLTVFRITAGLDTGPVIRTMPLEIANLRSDKVFERMLTAGKQLLPEALAVFAAGKITETEQDHALMTHSKKIAKNDGLLNPFLDSAEIALRKIRAFYPWPSAWIERDGKRIKLLDAAQSEQKATAGEFVYENKRLYLGFSDAALEILEIQPEGKRVMSGKEFGISLQKK